MRRKELDIAITEYTRVPQSKWSKIVKELFKNKCLYCGATDGGTIVTRLESHHIYQKKVFPELSDVLENGVCLCHPCHNAAHHASYLPGYTGMGFTYGYKNYNYDDVDRVIKEYVETSFIIEMSKEEYNKLKAHAKRQGESINALSTALLMKRWSVTGGQTMYDELVKQLREYARVCQQYEDNIYQLYDQAADAIEELQKRVPKRPHGRLIDADALIEDLKYDVELDAVALDSMEIVGDERSKIQDDKDFKQNCTFWIEDAPTVLEAEEGE